VVQRDTPAFVRFACDFAPDGTARAACFEQALTYAVYDSHGDIKPLFALCDAMSPEDQRACYEKAGFVIEKWYPGERSAKCTAAPELQRSACEGVQRTSDVP
jgi:hypothetical protein